MKALSLFSGIGGIDLAAEWAGIETVAFCEREPFCQKVLAKHWPNIPIYDDVCTLTKERLEQDGVGTIDLIHGGYPCQPFSLAGQREGTNDDRHLWPEVRRLLQELTPDWFVGENVVGHVTLGLDEVLSDLGDLGYTWQPFIIPACSVGADHRRERVFIVAHATFVRMEGEGAEQQTTGTSRKSEVVSYANSEGLERWTETVRQKKEWRTDTGYVGSSIGINGRDGQWDIEPNVGRVANGVPNRVDRLKALGNAVVPQQIYPILAAIKQINDSLGSETA